jgi:hypothetical protein
MSINVDHWQGIGRALAGSTSVNNTCPRYQVARFVKQMRTVTPDSFFRVERSKALKTAHELTFPLLTETSHCTINVSVTL